MKELELSVEEKAKQYDEAKHIMEEYMKSGDAEAIDTIKRAFPELENENDRIIRWIRKELEAKYVTDNIVNNVMADKALAWLEKKKDEQENKDDDFTIYHPLKNGKGEYECIPYSFYGSLVSFSEDKDLIDFLHTCFYTEEECEEWIRNYNNQGWNEDDEAHANLILRELEQDKNDSPDYSRHFARLIDWFTTRFKSFRPQNTWLPSDEQIEALRVARDRNDKIGFYLSQLYDNLKNLNKS